MKVVTTQQMRELEQAAVDRGASWAGLMEQAGWGVAQVVLSQMSPGARVLVLVGPGNNGGDGLVVARHIYDAGYPVTLYIWRREENEQDANWARCRQRAIPELRAEQDGDLAQLRDLLDTSTILIDALLGMGITRPISGLLADLIQLINQQRNGLLVAVDLPTGIDSDTGAVAGVALQADCTVATGLPKRGLFLSPGQRYAGTLAYADIGIPADYLEAIMSETLTAEYVRSLLPARPTDAHKGTFGKVLVVAGSLHYPGAATLACSSAGRVGAGVVTLAAGRTVLGVAGRGPEVTLLPLAEGEWGAVGPGAVDELAKHIDRYHALLLGPGLGQADTSKEFVQRLFGLDLPKTRTRVGFLHNAATPAAETNKPIELPPTVLDADGLNFLATIEDWPEHLPRERFVFTPHPGEMKRLLKVDTLSDDLVAIATDAATRWGQVVVLKGATTVIAGPDGTSLVHAAANPALATAGTGDVLAGIIAGLLAQGLGIFQAAALGVYLHGAAGAAVRAELGDAGALASDLLPQLPRAIKALRGK